MVMVSETYPSEFLKACELKGKPAQRLTIKAVNQVQMRRPALELAFHGTTKRLTLNKTSAVALQKAFGDNTAGWVGKDVYLKTGIVQFGGADVEVVLAEPANGNSNGHGSNGKQGSDGQQQRSSVIACVEKFNEMLKSGRKFYLVTLSGHGGLVLWSWDWDVAKLAKDLCGMGAEAQFSYRTVNNPKTGLVSQELLGVQDAPELQGAGERAGPTEDEIPF